MRKKWKLFSETLNPFRSVLQGTINVIRQSRRFFNQGLHVRNKKVTASMQIWNMLKSDLIHRTYSHAYYRNIVLLYLFQPTRCSIRFYMEVMPLWLDSWGTIDRCTSFDYKYTALKFYFPPKKCVVIAFFLLCHL